MEYLGSFSGIISIFFVLILYFLTFICICMNNKNTKVFVIVLSLAILVRITVAVVNFYYLKDFLPHSGADSVNFERHGYYLATGIIDIRSYSFDNYPLFISIIYSIIGREPFLIIGINGVLSILAAYFLYKSILLISNDNKKALLSLILFLFFPHSIIFSSVILRESMIVFFVSFSLFMFVKYTQQKKIIQLLLSIISLSFSSLLHAGIVFIIIGYFYYLINERGYAKSQLLKKPIVLIFLLIIIAGLFVFDDLFLKKFGNFNSIDSLVDSVSRGTENSGGSAYLQGYEVNSLQDVFLYAPLKFFYFFFSPMPWDIRNINDIIAFGFDSLIYCYFFIKLITKVRKLDWREPSNKIFISIFIGIIITGLVYALGTSNAGTALRHRYKLIILIIFAIFIPVKKKIRKLKRKKNILTFYSNLD